MSKNTDLETNSTKIIQPLAAFRLKSQVDGPFTGVILTDQVILGRAPSMDGSIRNIVLYETGYVSRQHAQINYKDGKFFIVDLRSSNHTYLNNQKLEPMEPVEIQHEDEIRMGTAENTYTFFRLIPS